MKKQEFNLSEKIKGAYIFLGTDEVIDKKDVKEFIKRLNLEMDFLSNPDWREFNTRLNKLLGDKLT